MNKQWTPRNLWIIRITSFLLFLIGFIIVLIMTVPSWAQWANQYNRLPAKICLIITALLPPFLFWMEYCFMWRNAKREERPNLEDFKYGQEVGRNTWLAFVGLILALYFK
jgi:membrane protease YdiL (CAAX protease family)